MKESLSLQIDYFLDALTVEKGLARNTVEAYSRDLNRLAEFGEKLKAGEIVITGSLSGPARAVKGDRDAVAEFTRLGRVTVRFSEILT